MSTTVDVIHAGTIIPVSYRNGRVASICYSPDLTAEEVYDLSAELTIFITNAGAYVPSMSKFVPHMVDETQLEVANPRDILHVIIPESAIDREDSIVSMISPVRYNVSEQVRIVSEAIYKPVAGHPSLYICMAEGMDALQYSDIPDDAVLKVSYMEPEATSPKHAFMRTVSCS